MGSLQIGGTGRTMAGRWGMGGRMSFSLCFSNFSPTVFCIFPFSRRTRSLYCYKAFQSLLGTGGKKTQSLHRGKVPKANKQKIKHSRRFSPFKPNSSPEELSGDNPITSQTALGGTRPPPWSEPDTGAVEGAIGGGVKGGPVGLLGTPSTPSGPGTLSWNSRPVKMRCTFARGGG